LENGVAYGENGMDYCVCILKIAGEIIQTLVAQFFSIFLNTGPLLHKKVKFLP
jgi:hypothetical protein